MPHGELDARYAERHLIQTECLSTECRYTDDMSHNLNGSKLRLRHSYLMNQTLRPDTTPVDLQANQRLLI